MKKYFYLFVVFAGMLLLSGCASLFSKEVIFIVDNTEFDRVETNISGFIDFPMPPSKDGYVFSGWYYGIARETKLLQSLKIKKDMTVYAKFDPLVADGNIIIYFDSSGGPTVEPLRVFENKYFAMPNPYREGYTFVGWKLVDAKTEYLSEDYFVKYPHGDQFMFATAEWRLDVFTITYELNGSTNHKKNPADYNIEKGTITFENPTKAGYEFLGWTTSQNPEIVMYPMIRALEENITVTAHFQVIDHYITYDYQGGIGSNPEHYNADGESFELVPPVKEGYIFHGWFVEDFVHSAIEIDKTFWIYRTFYIQNDADLDFHFEAFFIPEDSPIFTLVPNTKYISFSSHMYRSGDRVPTGTVLTFKFNTNYITHLFTGWMVNGVIASTDEVFNYTVADFDFEIEIVCESPVPYSKVNTNSEGAILVAYLKENTRFTIPDLVGNRVVITLDLEVDMIYDKAEYLYISSGVTTITPAFVRSLPNLKMIEISPLNTKYAVTPDKLGLYEIATGKLIIGLPGITLPPEVKIIGVSAFEGKTSLQAIFLPETISSIESDAFKGCTSLCQINITQKITNISTNAFKSCLGLTELFIPRNAESGIKNLAFSGCVNLVLSFEVNVSTLILNMPSYHGCKEVHSSVERP